MLSHTIFESLNTCLLLKGTIFRLYTRNVSNESAHYRKLCAEVDH
jgi:hypothetical protein